MNAEEAKEQTIEAQKGMYEYLIQESMQLILVAVARGRTNVQLPTSNLSIRLYLASLGFYTEYVVKDINYLYVSWGE